MLLPAIQMKIQRTFFDRFLGRLSNDSVRFQLETNKRFNFLWVANFLNKFLMSSSTGRWASNVDCIERVKCLVFLFCLSFENVWIKGVDADGKIGYLDSLDIEICEQAVTENDRFIIDFIVTVMHFRRMQVSAGQSRWVMRSHGHSRNVNVISDDEEERTTHRRRIRKTC